MGNIITADVKDNKVTDLFRLLLSQNGYEELEMKDYMDKEFFPSDFYDDKIFKVTVKTDMQENAKNEVTKILNTMLFMNIISLNRVFLYENSFELDEEKKYIIDNPTLLIPQNIFETTIIEDFYKKKLKDETDEMKEKESYMKLKNLIEKLTELHKKKLFHLALYLIDKLIDGFKDRRNKLLDETKDLNEEELKEYKLNSDTLKNYNNDPYNLKYIKDNLDLGDNLNKEIEKFLDSISIKRTVEIPEDELEESNLQLFSSVEKILSEEIDIKSSNLKNIEIDGYDMETLPAASIMEKIMNLDKIYLYAGIGIILFIFLLLILLMMGGGSNKKYDEYSSQQPLLPSSAMGAMI